jgi:hypothetical protein
MIRDFLELVAGCPIGARRRNRKLNYGIEELAPSDVWLANSGYDVKKEIDAPKGETSRNTN